MLFGGTDICIAELCANFTAIVIIYIFLSHDKVLTSEAVVSV